MAVEREVEREPVWRRNWLTVVLHGALLVPPTPRTRSATRDAPPLRLSCFWPGTK
ncbi:hypothetical protein ACFPIJ_17130 [Dactylosporangium cerinum]|uniref:Uncharacterized protein n=1 Tax=Dactylosporangium cerinum TaxID=1434730 RepID=A0ABV9VSZ1_9ACTN